MKTKPLILAAIFAIGLTASGCATQERFHWGAYEQALYVYAKKPDQGPAYEKALTRAIETGRRSKRIAPGLLAELGYMRLEQGDFSKAVSLFEEEMMLFPESKFFLSNVVLRAKARAAQPASVTQ